MSEVTVAWAGLSAGSFVAGAAIVGVLALRRAFEPLIALVGAIGMAAAGWCLVLVSEAFRRPGATASAALFAVAAGVGGYALSSALLERLAAPISAASEAVDASAVGDAESRPMVFVVACTEPEEYDPRTTARELQELADEGVLRLGLGVTPFLFAASKARYRASGGRSSSWRELERVTEALETRLGSALLGRVLPSSCEGGKALDKKVGDAVREGIRRITVIPFAVAESPALEMCKQTIDGMKLDALGVCVDYLPTLWSSDAVADTVSRQILGGALDPQTTGVVLVLHGQPAPHARKYPDFDTQETAFASRIRMTVTEGGIPTGNIRVAWAEWQQPDVTTAVRHLAALGCERILISPSVFPLDCIATQLEIPLMVRQARVEAIPVVMLPTWRDDEHVVQALERSAKASLASLGESSVASEAVPLGEAE